MLAVAAQSFQHHIGDVFPADLRQFTRLAFGFRVTNATSHTLTFIVIQSHFALDGIVCQRRLNPLRNRWFNHTKLCSHDCVWHNE